MCHQAAQIEYDAYPNSHRIKPGSQVDQPRDPLHPPLAISQKKKEGTMPTPTRKSAKASEAKNALVLVRRGRLRPTSNIVKQQTLWLLSEAISSYRHNGKNPVNNPKPGVFHTVITLSWLRSILLTRKWKHLHAPAPILFSAVLTYAYISHNNYTLTKSESNVVTGQRWWWLRLLKLASLVLFVAFYVSSNNLVFRE